VEHYAGIDVSFELSSVCVVDGRGKIVKEAKVANRKLMFVSSSDALVSYGRALAIRPVTLWELKRFDEAMASYDRALSVRPSFADGPSRVARLGLLENDRRCRVVDNAFLQSTIDRASMELLTKSAEGLRVCGNDQISRL